MENQTTELTTPETSDAGSVWSSWEDAYPGMANLVDVLNIVSVTISAFGILGNAFTMAVISQWTKISSGAAFMFTLAFTDLLAVFYDGVLDLALPLLGWTLANVNDWLCASGKFFSWVTSLTSYYITVLFGLDKCLAVILPFKYRTYGTVKTCVIASSIAYLVLGLYSFVHTVPVFRIHQPTGACRPVEFGILSREYFFGTRTEINYYVNGVIPIAMTVITTVITIVKLRMGSGKQASRSTTKRDSEITFQMIVVCVIFAIFCLGVTICVNLIIDIQSGTMEDEAKRGLLRSLQSNFAALINSINFYVYFIFGQKFRKDFLHLIGRAQTKPKTNTFHANAANTAAQRNEVSQQK